MTDRATQDDIQKLFGLFILNSLSLVKANAVARRKRRNKIFGNKKTEKFYSRVINKCGVRLDRI